MVSVAGEETPAVAESSMKLLLALPETARSAGEVRQSGACLASAQARQTDRPGLESANPRQFPRC